MMYMMHMKTGAAVEDGSAKLFGYAYFAVSPPSMTSSVPVI